jgi:hypothetical protein
MTDLSIYPGGDLVAKGLEDVAQGRHTIEARLVMVTRSNLVRLGLLASPHIYGPEALLELALPSLLKMDADVLSQELVPA